MKKRKVKVVEAAPVKVNTYHTNKVTRAKPLNISPELGPAEVNNLTKCIMTVSNPQNTLNDKPREVQKVQQAVNGKVADNLVGRVEIIDVESSVPPTDFVQIKKPKKSKA